ncbi:MAG: tripartite tricarboxylate transporter substrate binding protein [Betaproteobacteria bacterium]
MTRTRSIAQRIAALCALIAIHAASVFGDAQAQTPRFPSRPVHRIVGQQPGSAPDVVARYVAEKLAEAWGQPVVVENRSGAGGTIAAEAVAKAPADGYTLLLGSQSALALAAAVNADLRYDPLRDLAPIGRVATLPLFVVVRAALPVRSFREYVAYARENPGKLTFATLGPGTVPDILVGVIASTHGARVVTIPYRGVAGALNDLLAGVVDTMVSDATQAQPHVLAGSLRFIGVTGARRARIAPDVPTLAEQGLANFPIEAWLGLVAPAKTPPETVERLARDLAQVLATPAVRQRFENLGYDRIDDTPAQFAASLRAEIERTAELVRAGAGKRGEGVTSP